MAKSPFTSIPRTFVLALAVICYPGQVQSQGDTTLRRNTVKLDLTSYWLYRNAAMFSYERILKNKPSQSWGITAGLQQFPPVFGNLSDSVKVTRETKASGFKVGAEYRFYLKKENKYGAPRGVYIGPYGSFHNYSNGRSIEVDNNGTLENGEVEMNINILNIGVQLGYQFVLNNRWTIDLVFVGPSVSNYAANVKWKGNFTFDPDEISNEVVLALMDRFPGFEELIRESEFSSGGKVNHWGMGYRYQLQVGYHFGRKK